MLDLGLPDLEGAEVLRRLREWSKIPALILSVRDDEKQKVAALGAGADDYVTKPFGQEELLARLRVILRRKPDPDLPLFENAELRVDFTEHRVTAAGREVKLTATEYALLKLLVQHHGKVLTHRQILREIWGPDSEERTQYLRVCIAHLRQKIEPDSDHPGASKPIGYRLPFLPSLIPARRRRLRVKHQLRSPASAGISLSR